MRNVTSIARRRSVAAVLLTLVVATLVGTPPASAGGCDSYYPVHDRYEPGDMVTMVGYASGNTEGWRDNAPYVTTIRPGYEDDPDGTARPVPVGELEVTEVAGYVGWPGAQPTPALRATVSFTVPRELAPGRYDVVALGRDDTGLEWLCSGALHVGVDPDDPIDRSYGWPTDEPEWANVVRVPTPTTIMPPPEPAAPPPSSAPTSTTTSSTVTTSTSTTVAPPAPTTTVAASSPAEFASLARSGASDPTNGPPGWLVGLGSLLLLGAALAYGQRRTISQAPSEDRT